MAARPQDTPFDVIVVLGVSVLPDGSPSALLRGRVATAVRLFDAGRAPMLLLSGGKGNDRPAEAEVMRRLACAAGVPDDHVVIEATSSSTLENALYSARLMVCHGWRRALVVTDAVHLPRALLAFRIAGMSCRGAAVRGGARHIAAWRWPWILIREASGLLWYTALIFTGRYRRTTQAP